jgi:ABC-type glutathione transport system ATPase component
MDRTTRERDTATIKARDSTWLVVATKFYILSRDLSVYSAIPDKVIHMHSGSVESWGDTAYSAQCILDRWKKKNARCVKGEKRKRGKEELVSTCRERQMRRRGMEESACHLCLVEIGDTHPCTHGLELSTYLDLFLSCGANAYASRHCPPLPSKQH